LAKYPVSYTHVEIAPCPAFPNRRTTARPILPVILQNGGQEWSCYALVDSGADDVIFPASFAARLGFTLQRGAYYQFGGAGSANQPAWFFPLALNIGTAISMQAFVGFSPALESAGIGLLGQNGFFDRFRVEFDLQKNHFVIEQQ
jgi:hypothetical protein